jgi:methylated-DNA-[protein]-cysteine S-methyltransferase
MKVSGTNLFQTALGYCGLAWTERGIAGVQLPERDQAATRTRLMERFPELRETPAPIIVRSVRDGIIALLEGRPQNLSSVPLDMQAITPFRRDVYSAARQIARGETLTYGELAKRLGTPGSARAVGQALGCNPYPLIVPCHRVLAAGGKAGGFSAAGGVSTKLRILALERVNTSTVAEPKNEFAAAVDHLRAVDKILARTIDAVGPCLIEQKPTSSIFTALAKAIVYQQLNGRAAETIFGRVRALMPHSSNGPRAADLLKIDDVDLRGAGLSQAKMLALQDLARRTVAGEIPTVAKLSTMDDESIIQQLTVVRGIGRWTVEMLLMFRLGRLDILPVDDFGIREGYAVAFRRREPPTRQALAQHGERWRPYRSIASWYLWRALERARQGTS